MDVKVNIVTEERENKEELQNKGADKVEDNKGKDKYPYCLCIIDMQSAFSWAGRDPNTLSSVLELIRIAKEDKAYIFDIKLNNCGDVFPEIMELIKDYDRITHLTAYHNSKCSVILDEIRTKNIGTDSIKVCGVNTNACVLETVRDLVKEYKNDIVVVLDACNGYNHKSGIDSILALSENNANLKVQPETKPKTGPSCSAPRWATSDVSASSPFPLMPSSSTSVAEITSYDLAYILVGATAISLVIAVGLAFFRSSCKLTRV